MGRQSKTTWIWLDQELGTGFEVERSLYDQLLQMPSGIDELCTAMWEETASLDDQKMAVENRPQGEFDLAGRFYFPVTDGELVIEKNPETGAYLVHAQD